MKVIHGITKSKLITTLSIVFTFVLLSAFSLASSYNLVSAESFQTTEDVSFTFNPTVNITISGDLVISNLATSSTSDSNQITVTAASNSMMGYTLGSTVGSSSTNYTDLRISSSNSTNKFSSITANKASLSNFSDSNWGYSYSTNNGTNWKSGDITGSPASGYNGLPIYTSSSPIKIINANTNGSSSVLFKIGAKSSSSQVAGTYTNTINFIGVSKVITASYTINYNDPSSEATNMPSQQTGTSTTGAVNISSTEPTRANYIFKGWCTAQTSDDTCSGQTIKPGNLLALNPGTGSSTPSVTKTLYAMWYNNTCGHNTIAGITYMQDITSSNQASVLASLEAGKQYSLKDNRDNKEYCVAVLSDGNLWMTQNLDLDLSTSKTFTPADTDIKANWTPSKSTVALNSPESDGWINTGWWTGSNTTPESIDPGNYYWTGKLDTNNEHSVVFECLGQGGTIAECGYDTLINKYVSDTGIPNYHLGNLYNWTAAVAMNNSSSYTTPGTNTNQSICPAGWTLSDDPTIFSSYTQGPNGDIHKAPIYYPYSGVAGNLGYGNVGWDGLWWSGFTGDFSTTAYTLLIYADTLNPISTNSPQYYRDSGGSVRCVLRQSAPSMQNATSASLAELMPNTGDTATLRDERDGEEYLIGKLADGKYWMLDNLRLGGSSTMNLTPSNTNITSNWTLPASTTTSFTYTTAAINADSKNTTVTSYGSGSGKVGNYYNFCAASAGTYCYASGGGAGNASHDICPKGWRMPTGGSSGEYQALYTAYSSNATNFRNALSTPLSGGFEGDLAYDQGDYGTFWSSTRSDGDYMYLLWVNSSGAVPVSDNIRYGGNSMRCVKQ